MRLGVEVEINSSIDEIARELRPLMQNVRVMTLPHLSFEHCSVHRGTLGKVVLFCRKILLLLFLCGNLVILRRSSLFW